MSIETNVKCDVCDKASPTQKATDVARGLLAAVSPSIGNHTHLCAECGVAFEFWCKERKMGIGVPLRKPS